MTVLWSVIVIIVFLSLGWLVAGKSRPRDLLDVIDRLQLERDTQARTIDAQRHLNSDLEKELEQAKKDLAQSRENERIAVLDRGQLRYQLDSMALALRELPDESAREQFRQAYERANRK